MVQSMYSRSVLTTHKKVFQELDQVLSRSVLASSDMVEVITMLTGMMYVE